MTPRSLLFSWDFLASVLLGAISFLVLPTWVTAELAKDMYGIGISVLSIVVSVYFAALAIIIASSDDDFVRFLEETGEYTRIVASFKWSLGAMFVALLAALVLYAYTAGRFATGIIFQTKWLLTLFSYAFFYGLFAVAQSTRDAMIYAHYRTKYLLAKRRGNGE